MAWVPLTRTVTVPRTLETLLSVMVLAGALGCRTSVAAQSSSLPVTAGVAPDWSAVERALGRKGTMNPGDVLKFGFPRGDLHVMVRGVAIKPTLALGSWVAFKSIGTVTMAMGDLVLTEDEVEPVMRALQRSGIEQTALHNHVLGETPRVMYMHISATGDATKIASSIRTALELTKTPLIAPVVATAAIALDLDTVAIASALGAMGKGNGGVYQVAIARRETVRENGMDIPASMGLATAINFQSTGGGKAAITGDFVLLGSEVNPVMRALRSSGIDVTAVHSHMIGEEPRLYFMHFWADADAVTLAKGLRTALNETTSVRK